MLIPKSIFAIGKIAANEDTRIAIGHIQVKRLPDGSCQAIALDGRMAIVACWNDEELRKQIISPNWGDVTPVDNFEVLIPLKTWNEVGKLIPKRFSYHVDNCCSLDEHAATLPEGVEADTIACVVVKKHGAVHRLGFYIDKKLKFPDVLEAIPDYMLGKDAVEIGVNPDLLSKLLKAANDVTANDETEIIRLLVPNTPTRPIVGYCKSPTVKVTTTLMAKNLKGSGL